MTEPDNMTAVLAVMRDVMIAEADALTRMAGALDQTWADAVVMLDGVRRKGGRIIVCGIGKSGHIGRKIAASLASTGAPAVFMQGTEASHGDLGIVLTGDAMIMLSASGSTHELLDAAHACKDRGVPLVLISRKADSPLGRLATFTLPIPDLPEAGPLGLAPTTSAAAMLAAGDALAMALMSASGFTAADFSRNHPGGALGKAARAASGS
jgi:arabinose-5-phosphate isomerase